MNDPQSVQTRSISNTSRTVEQYNDQYCLQFENYVNQDTLIQHSKHNSKEFKEFENGTLNINETDIDYE